MNVYTTKYFVITDIAMKRHKFGNVKQYDNKLFFLNS